MAFITLVSLFLFTLFLGPIERWYPQDIHLGGHYCGKESKKKVCVSSESVKSNPGLELQEQHGLLGWHDTDGRSWGTGWVAPGTAVTPKLEGPWDCFLHGTMLPMCPSPFHMSPH